MGPRSFRFADVFSNLSTFALSLLCWAFSCSGIIPPAVAQTTITVPVASGAGIKFVLPERFGVNLDDSYPYGNNQLTANLISSEASFAPQIWSGASVCGTGSSILQWVDNNLNSPQPANFWQGATFEVISGTAIGSTGTITSSTAAVAGVLGSVLTGTWTAGCAPGDVMILRCRTALGTCGGGLTPAGAGLSFNGTVAYERSDLSPSSSQAQALQLSSGAAFTPPFDETIHGKVYINFNGTYTLSFRAKGITGSPTISYNVQRVGVAPFVSGTVTPTVSGTAGAGWTNYSFNFTANETGSQTPNTGNVNISVSGGTVLLQDVALTEAGTGGNTTAFRNATYQRLQALQPGILRFMTGGQWGCTFDNMIQNYGARSLCGSSNWYQFGSSIPYGLNDFLYLAAQVGADPWWTFSAYSTTTDMANMAAYFNAPCSSGNSYATIRCNFLAGTPYAGMTWTQVFHNIYLEMGNEIWNSPNGSNLWANGGATYGTLLGTNVSAFKSATYYGGTMHVVGSGFIVQSSGGYGWNAQVLNAAKNAGGLPDYIDGAPYLFDYMTDLSSTANIFGPMFAEAVNYNSVTSGAANTGFTYQLQNYSSTNYSGVNGAVYETSLGTNCALSGVTQAQINGVAAGIGSGLDATLNMLLAARDAGVKVQNFFALPGPGNAFYTATSDTSGCNYNSTLNQPLWGANLFMPGPTNSAAIDRPTGIALQLVNQAMGSKLNLLAVSQSGTPTYSQAAAQPNPTNSGAASIAANSAVPYVQSFGFGDGAGNYSLIVYNLNLTSSEAIAFAGAGAPAGTVTKTVFTSANITDNNESATVGSTPTVTTPSPSTLSSPTGDTLPPFSMTTYTWSTSSTASVTAVTVSCSPTSVNTGATASCSAGVAGIGSYSSAVTWTASAGTISSAGVYTAPATVPTSGAATITATSTQTGSVSGSVIIPITAAAAVTAVTVACSPTSVSAGATASCSASVAGTGSYSSAVTWTASAGTISSAGVYTAPATAPTSGTATITATSTQTGTVSGSATIAITAQATVTAIQVACSPTSVSAGATASCTAIVAGTGSYSSAVTWTASAGTISSTGVYTAPATAPTSGTATITATSTQTGTVSGSATIAITNGVSVALTPASGANPVILLTGTLQFTPSVSGTSNTAVTWSLSQALGSISASGLYTAPASNSIWHTVVVTATSVADPTKSASTSLMLAPSVSVSLSSGGVTAMSPSQTQTFTAAVANSSNTAVVWSITPAVGSISASGVYTAPASVTSNQTITITATSVADPTKSASTTITIAPPVTITRVFVACPRQTVSPGSSLSCSSKVNGTGAYSPIVTWKVSAGTIDQTGVYTAPATVPAKGATAVITAVSAQNTSIAGSATVLVIAPPSVTSVSVACPTAPVSPGSAVSCSHTVEGTGDFDSAVIWSASAGTINQEGKLTAVAGTPSIEVTATSRQTPSVSASATVLVKDPATVSSIVVSSIGPTTAKISWATNASTFNGVDWGTTPSYGQTTAGMAAPSANPSFKLTGLKAGTKYYVKLWSITPKGTLTSTLSFATLPN